MWRVVEWSREHGRGRILPDQGEPLDFDASAALVDDFRIGEEVHVELEQRGSSWRVARIWPDDPRFSPPHPPTAFAGALLPALEDLISSRLLRLDRREGYGIHEFTDERLLLRGHFRYAEREQAGLALPVSPPPPDEFTFLQPKYVEMLTYFDLKNVRLAAASERDYLLGRIGHLSRRDIAVTLIDKANRFHFIVAADVTYRVLAEEEAEA